MVTLKPLSDDPSTNALMEAVMPVCTKAYQQGWHDALETILTYRPNDQVVILALAQAKAALDAMK